MDKIRIRGGRKLSGTIRVSGSKNAALPILAATLLTDEPCVIHDVPETTDLKTMCRLLGELGLEVEFKDGTVRTKSRGEVSSIAPYDLVRTMRGSICVLGPLLAKRGHAEVAMPGGCVIGTRPIDLHIKGLVTLGADVGLKNGNVVASADKLSGATLYLGGASGSSCLGTANVLCAAVLAEGETIIEMAACEPEVVDLCDMLSSMGAKIKGAGTPRLIIEGVERLGGVEHRVIPDRIEAGTFMIAAAMTQGEIRLENVRTDHLIAVIDKLRLAGVVVDEGDGVVTTSLLGDRPIATDITTLPYPGFPTDMQAQFMALCAIAEGTSSLQEKIFPERFMHIGELTRLGSNIEHDQSRAWVHGMPNLSGAPVMASDLRASAALVLAGLVADGETTISRIYHLDRGYERVIEKLQGVGADIERISG